MEIEKKIWPQYFEKILSGEKSFEIRLADFEIGSGDVIVLREWNPDTKEYTGRKIEKEVRYVSKIKSLTTYSKEDIEKYGLQVIGF